MAPSFQELENLFARRIIHFQFQPHCEDLNEGRIVAT